MSDKSMLSIQILVNRKYAHSAHNLKSIKIENEEVEITEGADMGELKTIVDLSKVEKYDIIIIRK